MRHVFVFTLLAFILVIASPLGGVAGTNKYDGLGQYNAMLKALKVQGYTRYLQYLQSTGFNASLLQALYNHEVTILAFSNNAISQAPALQAILADRRKGPQLIGYNSLAGKYTFQDLIKLPNKVEVSRNGVSIT
eukprot:TRINITY_DN18396_c0_g1_i1.p1 TRINITY_DN18396_c0_g1~~TRINITY_DN18396_c0_g1_i1.p1  ORF type:complete len:134 (-),score=4.98 TRINITY_DN18396_c0_g1_i1:169-570(-)